MRTYDLVIKAFDFVQISQGWNFDVLSIFYIYTNNIIDMKK